MELYGKIGEQKIADLLADPNGAEKIAIDLEPGNGKLTRGTILYKKSTGMFAPATTSQMSTSYALAILDTDVDTDANPAVAEAAAAYIAGRFVRKAVKLASGDAITAAYALALRLENLTLYPIAPDETGFENGKTKVTYKANNGATPAEADYIGYGEVGATTILGNDTTGFTAPATKAFSKWNTKDDGSGTDYAAAASYTGKDDLVLYAVWA